MRDQRRAKWVVVAQLAGCCLLAGLLAAAVMFPFVGGAGTTILRVSNSATEESTQLLEGEMPIVSTMVDAAGNPIAWLYEQRRWVVPSNRIANTMKLAIIAIEDKRFTEHDGVDWQGTLTGLAGYLQGAETTRGGSTIEQQYVKNFNLLQAALAMDAALSKAEILARYLNPVSFGNGAFGVQDAAKTYFGINASDLNWQQAAVLAGMVRSPSSLDP